MFPIWNRFRWRRRSGIGTYARFLTQTGTNRKLVLEPKDNDAHIYVGSRRFALDLPSILTGYNASGGYFDPANGIVDDIGFVQRIEPQGAGGSGDPAINQAVGGLFLENGFSVFMEVYFNPSQSRYSSIITGVDGVSYFEISVGSGGDATYSTPDVSDDLAAGVFTDADKIMIGLTFRKTHVEFGHSGSGMISVELPAPIEAFDYLGFVAPYNGNVQNNQGSIERVVIFTPPKSIEVMNANLGYV